MIFSIFFVIKPHFDNKKLREEGIFKLKCWRKLCWWCQFSNKYNFIMMAALVVWSGLTLLGKYTRFIKNASSKKCPKFDGSLPYYTDHYNRQMIKAYDHKRPSFSFTLQQQCRDQYKISSSREDLLLPDYQLKTESLIKFP